MSRDFIDDDLMPQAERVDERPGAEARIDVSADSFYGRKKQELPEQMNEASDEIERLRQRQELLERRKQELVEQRRRIEAFEHNRRDMLDKLGRSAVLVVREGEQASRMAALCSEAGTLFSKLHQEMESFFPERWSEEEYDTMLTKALAKVEAASSEYRRVMDKINALGWNRGTGKGGEAGGGLAELETGRSGGMPRGFLDWLLAGVAFTLPLLLLLLLWIVINLTLLR